MRNKAAWTLARTFVNNTLQSAGLAKDNDGDICTDTSIEDALMHGNGSQLIDHKSRMKEKNLTQMIEVLHTKLEGLDRLGTRVCSTVLEVS
jgi:hypothetical protein